MNDATLQAFRKLLQLLLSERECAKTLDVEGLQSIVEEKNALLASMPEIEENQMTAELRELAGQIQKENRRNAYLFWSSLNWVRDTMNFYSRQFSTPAYGGSGQRVNGMQGGSLLSGKI